MFRRGERDEANGQNDFDEDKGEFDPEGDGENAVLALIVSAESLVLSADEDGADDVSDDEKTEAEIVDSWEVVGILHTQQDESCSSDKGEKYAAKAENLLGS